MRSARTKRLTPSSTKTRLAGRLGIAVPPVGRQIPVSVKTSGDRSAGFFDARGSGVVTCATELSILGNRDEFDPFRYLLFYFYVICYHFTKVCFELSSSFSSMNVINALIGVYEVEVT